jgi:hypothetical protein
MGFHQPFDLYYFFVNVFAGNLTIFLTISFAVIAAMAGMFRMPNIITGVFLALFIIMLGVTSGNLLVLVLLVAGIIIGWTFVRYMK